MDQAELDAWHMRRALQLAERGRGFVEPNPMVGCVIARGAEIIGEGWHRAFGQPHAEVEALRLAGPRAAGATMYVTLEPCCHHGKTPPCTQAVIRAGITRVVVAMRDPFPLVAGQGLAELERAGIQVSVGLMETESRYLNAPYIKLINQNRPWVIAKWAMTLDGKIATHTGDSRWVSGESSRNLVHKLRGRVDAVIVGIGTAQIDDPLLTARPPGPRTAVRIVLDSLGRLPLTSQLVRTARDVPVLVAVSRQAPPDARKQLESCGCEVFECPGDSHVERLIALLDELGRRRMTNVLFEGGSTVFGTLFDHQLVDEVHAFIAPKIVGGHDGRTPVGGIGVERLTHAQIFRSLHCERSGDDIYVSGRLETA
ncbi:MAG: bifunctional diaminohydroxyphosphoribosylaminopyrimidine deaminase/5-amino-6-(5-phosphoribosylamino)uracil reductase RibD [Thermogutta sp.]